MPLNLADKNGQVWPADEVDARIETVAGEFRRLGLQPFDTVLVYLPHTPLLAVTLLALERHGAVFLTAEKSMSVAELNELTARLRPRLIITNALLGGCFAGASEVCGELLIFNRPAAEPLAVLREKKVAALLQTSGSTGARKVVMITAVDLRLRAAMEQRDFSLTPPDRILNVLSFCHDLGLNQLFSAKHTGCTMSVCNVISPVDVIRLLREGDFTGLTATPQMWLNVMNYNRGDVVTRKLRYLTISGGSLPLEKIARLRELFPGARIIKTYGQTETFRSLIRYEDQPSVSAGSAVPGVEVTFAPAGGGLFELIHSGPGTSAGYLFGGGTEKFFELNGRPAVRTGDFFELLGNGEARFAGRRDDMFKKCDQRIYPRAIEQVLLQAPGVSAAKVFPVKAGDDVRIVAVVAAENAGEEMLRDLARTRLRKYEVPDRIVIVGELPVTDYGKVNVRRLAEEYAGV